MDGQQEFCLCWNNHQLNLVSSFHDLRKELDFVDVTLACEGQSLQAHKVVLSACSPFFRHLFTTTPCRHPIIVLKDIAYKDLTLLVEYCYMGTVRVKEDALSSFLKAAEVLKVCGLAESSKTKAKTSPNTSAADNQNDETSVLASSHHPFNDHCADVGSVSNFNSFPLFPNDSKTEPNTNSSDVVSGSSKLTDVDVATIHTNAIEPIDIKVEDMNFDSDNNCSEDENAVSNNQEHEIEPNDDHTTIGCQLDGPQLLTPQNFARIASSTSEDISVDSLHFSNAFEKQHPDPLSGIFEFESNTMANDSCQAPTQVRQVPGRVSSSDRPRWPCPFCNRLLASRSSVRRHIEDKHSAVTTRHQCILCERQYRTRNSLQYHLSTAHRDRVHTATRGRPRIRPTSPSVTESNISQETDRMSQNFVNGPNLNSTSHPL